MQSLPAPAAAGSPAGKPPAVFPVYIILFQYKIIIVFILKIYLLIFMYIVILCFYFRGENAATGGVILPQRLRSLKKQMHARRWPKIIAAIPPQFGRREFLRRGAYFKKTTRRVLKNLWHRCCIKQKRKRRNKKQ